MRIYFLSSVTAGLKLNGVYAGVIGEFEKFIELDLGQEVLAEAVPDGAYLPVNFFISARLFKSPPPFLQVFLCDGDVVIYVARYECSERVLRVVAQGTLGDMRATLFLEGGRVHLTCEGSACNLYELADSFKNGEFIKDSIGGLPVLILKGEECVCIISEEGKRVFYNGVKSFKTGDMLEVTVEFETCAGYFAECEYSFDGQKMKLEKSVTKSVRDVPQKLLHFAFFESLLTRADPTPFLSEELIGRVGDLHDYLGEFADVTIPHSSFYNKHGDIDAVGLVYPLSSNLFKVKYYSVDIVDGKIDNIKRLSE